MFHLACIYMCSPQSHYSWPTLGAPCSYERGIYPQIACVGMQAGVSGASKEAPRKGLRKIRPTVPVLAPSSAPSVPVPAVVTRLAAGEQSDAKRKLQSAFLAMYSNSESKVLLMPRCHTGVKDEEVRVFRHAQKAWRLSVLVVQKATCTEKVMHIAAMQCHSCRCA